MESIVESILTHLDYANRYVTLKIMRTLLISIILMLILLFLRQTLLKQKGGGHNEAKLYMRVWLWILLVPVPFLGTLKISIEHFRWRNPIYLFLYERIMGNSLWGRIYFAGIAVMASLFLIRSIRMRRLIQKMPVWEKEQPVSKGKKSGKIQIRLSPFPVTPFATGIICPVIVLPETMVEIFSGSELKEILYHETNHIRRGHLLLYVLIDCYRILWFPNPLVHLCARWIKDDLEMICDLDTISGGELMPEQYGMLLIKSVDCIGTAAGKQLPERMTPALASKRSFRVMKKRIQMISGYKSCSRRLRQGIAGLTGVLVLAVFVLGRYFSYPAYTPYGDYSLYSFDGKQAVFQNNAEFNAAVTVTDTGLLVQNDKVKEMLERDGESHGSEYFWIYYGGYMKMPGIGGGGDVVEYHPYETQDSVVRIFVNEKSRLSSVLEWFYKHM